VKNREKIMLFTNKIDKVNKKLEKMIEEKMELLRKEKTLEEQVKNHRIFSSVEVARILSEIK
jgi:cell division septum initiation protein DivIVA